MARRQRKLKTIERLWQERFGEPPFLRTDPDLMMKILEADRAKRPARAEPCVS